MYATFASLFGFGSYVSNQTSSNILFDYKTQPNIYLSRCKPILENMINCGLIEKLRTCHSVEDFGLPNYFTQYDLEDIEFARSMLEKICNNPSEISINTDLELKQIVKIIMKKYLIDKINQTNISTNLKVYIEVLIPNSLKIQVVSYANETKVVSLTNETMISYANKTTEIQPKLKDPGGSIEFDETPKEAGIRELVEELGLIIDKSRLKLIKSTDKIFKYQIILDEKEYQNYIKHINKLDIDPEITMICIVKI